MMKRYNKFLIALFGAALVLCQETFGLGPEWVNVMIAAGTALGVYQLPNEDA